MSLALALTLAAGQASAQSQSQSPPGTTRNGITSRQEQWEPLSRGGMATVGAIRFESTRLTSVSGDALNLVPLGTVANFLVPVSHVRQGTVLMPVTADLFRVDPPADVRGLNGLWLCGGDTRRPLNLVAIWVGFDFLGRQSPDEREVAFFVGAAQPRRADQPEPCFKGRFVRVDAVPTPATPLQVQQPSAAAPPRGAGRSSSASVRPRLSRCDQLAISSDTFDGFHALVEAGFSAESVAMGRAGGVTFRAINPQQAIPACREAAAVTPGSGRVWFQLGRALERGNQLPQAIAAYERGAELGSLDAVNNLAELYRDGKGVPRDLARAEAMFRQAAEGSVEATASLVEMLIRRDGAHGFDEALTLIAAITPTDVSVSARILNRLAAVTARVPEQVRLQATGPSSYRADVQITIRPNRPDGTFCANNNSSEICLPSERLSIASQSAVFQRAELTELAEDSAEIDATGGLSLTLLARDVFRLRYIHRATLQLSSAAESSDERRVNVEGRALRSVSAGCWQGDVMMVCLRQPASTSAR